MNNSHPAEMDIQQYTLDKTTCTTTVISHIEFCPFCRKQVSLYKMVFSGIEDQDKPVFDFDVQTMLLKKLTPSRPRQSAADRFVAGFLIFFIFSCIGIPLYLFRIYLLNMFSGISPFFIYSIVASAAIFIVTKTLESYRKYRRQLSFLNFN